MEEERSLTHRNSIFPASTFSPPNSSFVSTLSNVHVKGSKSSTKRQRREILSEEEYTSTLSSIITRDYFPTLPTLHRDVALLHRRQMGDFSGAIEIRRAARKWAEQEEELARQEQEEEEKARRESSKGIRVHPRPLHRENIDGFHARVTSEDNDEFERQMRRETQSQRQRMQIIYNSSGSDASKVGQRLLQMTKEEDGEAGTDTTCRTIQSSRDGALSPTYASDHFNAPVNRIHVAGTTFDGKQNTTFRNSFFFTPIHHAITDMPSNSTHEKEELKGLLVGKEDDLRLLMPPPPSISKPNNATKNEHGTDLQLSFDRQESQQDLPLVEYIAKPIGDMEKRIVPSQTRFPNQVESQLLNPSLMLSSKVPTRTDINPYDTESSAYSTDLDASLDSIEMERSKRKLWLERERNTLVALTPLIIPGQGNMARTTQEGKTNPNASPIMTWGNVASTPLVVSASMSTIEDDSKSLKTFVFANEDPTEKLARVAEANLAKKAKRYRNAGDTVGEVAETRLKGGTPRRKSKNQTPIQSSVLDRTKTLTPSAKSLLQKIHGSSSTVSSNMRSSMALGLALRESYTPKSIRPYRHGSDACNKRNDLSLKDTPSRLDNNECS